MSEPKVIQVSGDGHNFIALMDDGTVLRKYATMTATYWEDITPYTEMEVVET